MLKIGHPLFDTNSYATLNSTEADFKIYAYEEFLRNIPDLEELIFSLPEEGIEAPSYSRFQANVINALRALSRPTFRRWRDMNWLTVSDMPQEEQRLAEEASQPSVEKTKNILRTFLDEHGAKYSSEEFDIL